MAEWPIVLAARERIGLVLCYSDSARSDIWSRSIPNWRGPTRTPSMDRWNFAHHRLDCASVYRFRFVWGDLITRALPP